MNSIERYYIWFTIHITHEYYDNENCPIVLAPSRETILFFRRNRIIYKMTEQNKWILLAQSEDFIMDTTDTLCFEMIPQDNIFYYVTELPQQAGTENYILEKNSVVGKWMNVLIPSGSINEEIDIKLESKLKYWEFIIIPRYTANNANLRIEEKRDRIKFGDIEETQFPRVGKAFRVSTVEKNKAKETQDYVIRLYEIRSNGERLLSGNIPRPRPDEPSITQPRDTVTTYFYI
ncbi:hypothetical protein [Dysgonomonas sp. ZJ279]|uniref:hypothetical protein n=1 Tax=Dysgonomonas sp. ZJ279 TaxID=2709796 RepID=UPI0013EBFA9E|nr:hypothetical protein [Dysgonomonas sp. ZJ279]